MLDPLNDGVPQLWQSYQFTQIIPAFPGLVIGRRTILARKIRHLDIVKTALSQILQVNSMLTMGREVAAPDIAERADDFEYHCRKAEAPVEG